jgi:hypothetical protein
MRAGRPLYIREGLPARVLRGGSSAGGTAAPRRAAPIRCGEFWQRRCRARPDGSSKGDRPAAMMPYSMARPALYCRQHDLPRELREGFETPRERPGQGWQCAGMTWADPVGVALPDVPERQCTGVLVSHADRGAERRAQDDDDRGTGAQVADRAVAPGHDRRGHLYGTAMPTIKVRI